MPDYIDSYYTRTLASTTERRALAGRHAADVCIVGGGLAGLTTALELRRRGLSVVLLEAHAVGWGASGRNGGFVSAGFARSLSSIEAAVGTDAARELYRMSIEGVGIVEANIRDHGIAEARPVRGIFKVIRYDDAAGLQAHRARLIREFGHMLDYWPTARVRETLRSQRYHQALLDNDAFHIHPLNYVRGLASAIDRQGGQIHDRSPVVALDLAGPEKIVRTAAGEVRARHVVMACGGYTGTLIPRLRRSHLPIATYVLATEPARERLAEVIRTRAAALDDRRAGDYYRLVDDGARLLWGGRITTRTSEPRQLATLLRRTMIDTYPQLADLRVELAWSGLMSYARHLMPQIGQLQDGVWYCMGFGGHGLNTTAIGGRVIAEAIAGDGDRIRHFAPFGLAWNGGPFGVAAAQLTYWTYQGLDWLRERRAA